MALAGEKKMLKFSNFQYRSMTSHMCVIWSRVNPPTHTHENSHWRLPQSNRARRSNFFFSCAAIRISDVISSVPTTRWCCCSGPDENSLQDYSYIFSLHFRLFPTLPLTMRNDREGNRTREKHTGRGKELDQDELKWELDFCAKYPHSILILIFRILTASLKEIYRLLAATAATTSNSELTLAGVETKK